MPEGARRRPSRPALALLVKFLPVRMPFLQLGRRLTLPKQSAGNAGERWKVSETRAENEHLKRAESGAFRRPAPPRPVPRNRPAGLRAFPFSRR